MAEATAEAAEQYRAAKSRAQPWRGCRTSPATSAAFERRSPCRRNWPATTNDTAAARSQGIRRRFGGSSRVQVGWRSGGGGCRATVRGRRLSAAFGAARARARERDTWTRRTIAWFGRGVSAKGVAGCQNGCFGKSTLRRRCTPLESSGARLNCADQQVRCATRTAATRHRAALVLCSFLRLSSLSATVQLFSSAFFTRKQ